MKRRPEKSINGPADLAIHGAVPAFPDPLHVGRPNLGDVELFKRRMNDILSSRWFTNNGPQVQELESGISRYLGTKHCVAMCNGTIALEIAIRALDLKDEVIVPSFTFIATAHALHWQGITPVFADIDPKTHNLDPESVARRITTNTTGIIGVHLWGRPAPVRDLEVIAREHGLKLMYDAAHAFGCSSAGKMIGSFGECEVLSFHATKFFNTFEGGAVVTNDDVLAEKMRLMRNFGFSGYDNVIYAGTNGKMPEICAAMGLANLDVLDEIIASNRKNYEAYRRGLADIEGLELLTPDAGNGSNYQYIVVEVSSGFPLSRDELVELLHAENILARRYFWPGCHRMKPYREIFPGVGELLPNTEAVADRVIVLPSGTSVDAAAIGTITEVLRHAAEPMNRTARIAAS